MRSIQVIVLFLAVTSCALQYARPHDNVVRTSSEPMPESPVPLRIQTSRTFLNSDVRRRIFDSEVIRSDDRARLRLEIKHSRTPGPVEVNASLSFFILSFGLLPFIAEIPYTSEFRILDEQSRTVRYYRVVTDQWTIGQLLGILLYPVNWIGPDSLEVTSVFGMTGRTSVSQVLGFVQFEQQLAEDLKDPDFRSLFTLDESEAVYALLRSSGNVPPEVARTVQYYLEEELDRIGLTLVERNRLDAVIEQQALSQSGLSDREAIRIGRMLSAGYILAPEIIFSRATRGEAGESPASLTVSLRCIDTSNGKILWKQQRTLSARPDERMDDLVQSVVRILILFLKKDNLI